MRKNFYSNLFIKAITYYVIGSLAVSDLQAQVLNNDLTLTTQAQVDAFNYTEINGTLSVTGADITNLNGLSELTKCQNLSISNNPALTSVIGLANLGEVVHNLTIQSNGSLTNVTGFSSLTTVGNLNTDALTIANNGNLLNIDGLFSLTFATKLVISSNSKLTNLNGLSALTFVEHSFIVSNNPLLTSLAGLSHLTSISSLSSNLASDKLIIDNNDALTNVNGLSGVIFVGGLAIRNNAALINLDGLSNLEDTKYGGIVIENNPSLISIEGLSHAGPFCADLKIINNASLANVDGLSGITGLTDIDAEHNLEIRNNVLLSNLNGLSSLVAISGDLVIDGNPALIDISGLSKLVLVKEALRIKNNLVLPNIDGLFKLAKIHTLEITNNNALTNLNGLSALQLVVGTITITNNPALTDFCGLYNLFKDGDIGGAIVITTNGANTIKVIPRADVRVNADAGLCSAVVSDLLIGSAIVEGCLVDITGGHSDFPAGNVFPVGTTTITWTAVDGAGNTAVAIQWVIVTDNQAPKIISGPSDKNVTCAADVPAVDLTSVTATDNCSDVTISHVGDVITNQTCANRFTVTRTYKATDAHNNTATYSQIITVNDNTPPQINGLAISQSSLWPADHSMRDITVNYTITDNCVNNPTFSISVNSNEPVNGVADGDTDPDWIIVDNHHIKLRAERAANGDGRIYTITITANDGCNAPVSASTQVRVAHNITGPHSGNPFKIGSTVTFTGMFWDKPGNTHSAKWLIDDNLSIKGITTEPTLSKNGQVTGSYKFTSPGVYKLQMNITDQNGIISYSDMNSDLEEIIVIFDPNGGNTYGGGYFNSPAGALRSNPSATGKASYGFAMNYFKNSTYPKGETQFEFKVGTFEFNALNFEYLVISNSMAQFKGTGKITGGQSGVGFTMTVVDGQLDGTGIDKIRMKIYNKNNGSIIYDNQPGASDATLPTQAVGANSSIVISGTNSSLTQSNTTQKAEMEATAPEVSRGLDVIAYPNPSATNFSIIIKANSDKEKITMQVVDMYGRIIETRNVNANSPIRFGDRYNSGTYFVRIMQGKEHKEIKLIKLSD